MLKIEFVFLTIDMEIPGDICELIFHFAECISQLALTHTNKFFARFSDQLHGCVTRYTMKALVSDTKLFIWAYETGYRRGIRSATVLSAKYNHTVFAYISANGHHCNFNRVHKVAPPGSIPAQIIKNRYGKKAVYRWDAIEHHLKDMIYSKNIAGFETALPNVMWNGNVLECVKWIIAAKFYDAIAVPKFRKKIIKCFPKHGKKWLERVTNIGDQIMVKILLQILPIDIAFAYTGHILDGVAYSGHMHIAEWLIPKFAARYYQDRPPFYMRRRAFLPQCVVVFWSDIKHGAWRVRKIGGRYFHYQVVIKYWLTKQMFGNDDIPFKVFSSW